MTMGDIGKRRKTIEVLPETEPARQPETEPAKEPVKEPEREPARQS